MNEDELLTKVLSKFKKAEKTNYRMYQKYYSFMEDGAILYRERDFYLSSWSDEVKISLKTVESLLKDLGEEL